MGKQKKIKQPGSTFSIRIPLDIDTNVLEWINDQENLNETFLELARREILGTMKNESLSTRMDFLLESLQQEMALLEEKVVTPPWLTMLQGTNDPKNMDYVADKIVEKLVDKLLQNGIPFHGVEDASPQVEDLSEAKSLDEPSNNGEEVATELLDNLMNVEMWS